MTESLIEAFAVLFVTLGPVTNAVVFSGMARGRSFAARRKVAVKAVLVSLLIMVGFGLFGDDLLKWMGIHLSSLEIAGGILLLLLAIRMVMAESKWRGEDQLEESNPAEFESMAIYPLALPLIAGPDANVAIIMLMSKAGGNLKLQTSIMGIMIGMLALLFLCLLAAGAISRLLGKHGGEVITRLQGVLLTALAVEFIVNGLARAGLFSGNLIN